jgi:hypothetical protein
MSDSRLQDLDHWLHTAPGAGHVQGGLPPAQDSALQLLTTLDDFRAATLRILQHTERSLALLTDEVDVELFDHPPVLEAFKHFLVARRHPRLRVLLRRPLRSIGKTHRFVTQARRLTGSVEFRIVPAGLATDGSCVLIGDSRYICCRTRSSAWQGVAGYRQPPMLRVHQQEFERLWLQSPRPGDIVVV